MVILRIFFKILIIICSLNLTTFVIAQETSDWKLTRNHNNIKVYLRKHEGSALKEVLGVIELKANLSALISLIKDTENHYKWMYANKKSELLKTSGNFEWVLYTQSEAPWPITDRELISRAKMSQDMKTCTVRIESVGIPNYLPPSKKLVRIKKMRSLWELIPKKGGVIKVKFKILVDLGGNIPKWLINLAIDKGPYYTLLNLSKTLKNNKYQNIKLPYLKESCPY